MHEGEVLLIEVLHRGALADVARELAAAEQIADERDLAAADERDERARRVTGDDDRFAVDTARMEIEAILDGDVGPERIVVRRDDHLEQLGEEARRFELAVQAL